ncbi:MAG: sulfotransferase domain-containing protein [Sumerlaeia bacterium]
MMTLAEPKAEMESSGDTPPAALPNFIMVGAPKCGTTAMFRYLSAHPEVFMSDPKEPMYFNYMGDGSGSDEATYVTNWTEYRNLFSGAAGKAAIGEASTWYLYSPAAAKRIHDRLPDAKIIAFLRQPVDRAWSLYNFNIQRRKGELATFEEELAREPEFVEKRSSWERHYLGFGRYGEQLERYYTLFPRENIRVYLMDEIQADSVAVARDLLQFIGVDPSFAKDAVKGANVTFVPKNKAIHKFFGNQGLRALTAKILPEAIKRRIRKVERDNMTRPPKLDPALREKLTRPFHDDFRKIEELTGKDLSAWYAKDSAGAAKG